jgi:hypothetical protein
MKRMWLIAAALVALAGCSDTVDVGSNAPGSDAGVDTTPEPDVGDDAQDDTAEPDTDPECTDASCGEGSICEDGACVAGCRTNEDCASPNLTQVCFENRCVGCRDDQDCSLETLCVADACVDGCTDDDGCREGRICGEDGLCADGCREDAACPDRSICADTTCVEGCRAHNDCPLGMICTDNACADGCTDDARCQGGTICQEEVCTAGCRADDGCDRGTICTDEACVEGCRDDQGCDPDKLCLDEVCIFAGVGCRDDEDCDEGDVCNVELQRCEAGEEACLPDDFEPNDTAVQSRTLSEPLRASICPGDQDWFEFDVRGDDELEIELTYNIEAGQLEARLYMEETEVDATVTRNDGGLTLAYVARDAGLYTLRIAATEPATRATYGLALTITQPMMCVDTEIFRDEDEDGFGDDDDSQFACLEDDEQRDGYVRDGGDCGPGDALRYPGAEGICGDRVDDDCQGGDEACPETQDSPPAVPDWDCTGDPPASVYAWARFDSGQGYFRDGGCFFFFEGLPGEFYVKRNLTRANDDPACDLRSGCTCPSLNGWPAYDRRMYAFTLQGSIDDCPDIWLRDHAQDDANLMVSNACRKYLLQLHETVPADIAFVTGNIENLRQRLALYPSVEVACVEDRPHRNLPYQSLLQADINLNPDFQRQ